MLDARQERLLLDFLQPRCLEELYQVALARSGKLGFIDDIGVQLPRGSPEGAERAAAAAVIPDTGSHDTAQPSHATHLA